MRINLDKEIIIKASQLLDNNPIKLEKELIKCYNNYQKNYKYKFGNKYKEPAYLKLKYLNKTININLNGKDLSIIFHIENKLAEDLSNSYFDYESFSKEIIKSNLIQKDIILGIIDLLKFKIKYKELKYTSPMSFSYKYKTELVFKISILKTTENVEVFKYEQRTDILNLSNLCKEIYMNYKAPTNPLDDESNIIFKLKNGEINSTYLDYFNQKYDINIKNFESILNFDPKIIEILEY